MLSVSLFSVHDSLPDSLPGELKPAGLNSLAEVFHLASLYVRGCTVFCSFCQQHGPASSKEGVTRRQQGLGEADASQNNGCISEKPAVTDSTGAEGPRQPWISAASTDDSDAATPRPHLVRLFSRDAPGREDNTFKDRPSESDELQTIQEHSGAASECGETRAPHLTNTRILPTTTYNHGIRKQLCTGRLRAGPEEEEPRPPGSDWKVLWRGQEEEEQANHAERLAECFDKGSFRGALSPAPQKASATSPRKRGAENAVVHFFRTIVSNRKDSLYTSLTVSPAPPKSRGDQKSSKKASAGDGKGTLTRIFKM
ncbi:hypothetical protein L3Q82_013561, partial [Scortum barcoo]